MINYNKFTFYNTFRKRIMWINIVNLIVTTLFKEKQNLIILFVTKFILQVNLQKLL